MATISRYATATGATRYRVRYRTPNHKQTDRRGFKTKRDARAWADQLEVDKRKGIYVAPASVHKSVGVLRQVLAMAVTDNRLAMNPVDGVELPAVPSVEQRFLTLDQLHKLATAAGAHRPLVYILGTCGLRFGEAAELRWRDVDLDLQKMRINRSVTLVNGVFEVGSPKNGKARTVSLPAFVVDLLGQRGDLDALVFPDSEGGHMRGTNVRRRWWSQAVAAAELFPRTVTEATGEEATAYDFKLHELRHTAASLAIQAGANIKALQNMLGHESAGLTLDRYGHLYGSDVEAVGVALNELLTRNCGQVVGTGANPTASLRVVSSA